MFYKYKAILNPSKKDIAFHKMMCNKIYQKLEILLENLTLGKIVIDRKVKDASRICRIPGTFNNKAGRYAMLEWINEENVYKPEELCFAFGIEDDKNTSSKERKKRDNKIQSLSLEKKANRRNETTDIKKQIRTTDDYPAKYYLYCIAKMLNQQTKTEFCQ